MCVCVLTGVEVLDVGLLSLSFQLLPSDRLSLLHLELHLTAGGGGGGGKEMHEEGVKK